MSNWAPLARIILRYIIGGAIMGSATIGDRLAADPDLVAVIAFGIGALVEAFYIYARKTGKAT